LIGKYRHEVTLFPDLHEVKRSEDPYEYGGPWTKDNPLCRKQAMKIITPCYPQANTTSKVSNLQLLAIKTELSRGLALAQSIVDARGSNMSEVLDRLLSPFSFFDRYTHYIMITASAETKVQLLDSQTCFLLPAFPLCITHSLFRIHFHPSKKISACRLLVAEITSSSSWKQKRARMLTLHIHFLCGCSTVARLLMLWLCLMELPMPQRE
jgi:hypothetical protein